MITEPIHVTDAAFEKTILQSPVPAIVDFCTLENSWWQR